MHIESKDQAKCVVSETDIICKDTGCKIGWRVVWNTEEVDYVWLNQMIKSDPKVLISQNPVRLYPEILTHGAIEKHNIRA